MLPSDRPVHPTGRNPGWSWKFAVLSASADGGARLVESGPEVAEPHEGPAAQPPTVTGSASVRVGASSCSADGSSAGTAGIWPV